jgi:hypothetical protein
MVLFGNHILLSKLKSEFKTLISSSRINPKLKFRNRNENIYQNRR